MKTPVPGFLTARDKRFRLQAVALWTGAGLVVLGAHTACALVFLSWHTPKLTTGAPPAAILIDLPPAPSNDAAQLHKARRLDNSRNGDERAEVTGSISRTLVSENGKMQGASDFAAMEQTPSGETNPSRQAEIHTGKRHRRHRVVRKAAKHPRHVGHRYVMLPRSVVSLTDRSDNALPVPAARFRAATVGTAVTAADIPSTWKSSLLAQLERHKRYPAAAREKHEEGTTLLSFTIDREGHVLDSFIVHSSGYPALDDETLAMLQRAAPLPKMPPEIPGESLQLVVPVHFSVQ